MAYTFIFIRRDRTDKEPYTVNLSKPKLYGLIGAAIGLPILGFLLSTFVLAPFYMDREVRVAQKGYKEGKVKIEALEESNRNLADTNEFLQKELSQEREARAQVEAHITIAESARAEAVERSQDLEKKLAEKERQLVFYQAFVKPQTEQKDLQCFNISASLSKGQLEYGVNFLRTDQKAKDRLSTSVAFRVLSGENVIELNEGRAFVPPVHERDMSLVKQNRLTGKFKASLADEGLRILDIKAYDNEKRIVAHCWKAF